MKNILLAFFIFTIFFKAHAKVNSLSLLKYSDNIKYKVVYSLVDCMILLIKIDEVLGSAVPFVAFMIFPIKNPVSFFSPFLNLIVSFGFFADQSKQAAKNQNYSR